MIILHDKRVFLTAAINLYFLLSEADSYYTEYNLNTYLIVWYMSVSTMQVNKPFINSTLYTGRIEKLPTQNHMVLPVTSGKNPLGP